MRRVFVVCVLLLSFFKVVLPAYAEEGNVPDKGNASPIQEEIKKEEIVNKDEVLNKDEVYKMLLDSKSEKIGLMQGNISSILAVFGLIIAVLAVVATVFGIRLNKNFSERYDEIKKIKDEIDTEKGNLDALKSSMLKTNEELNSAKKELEQKDQKLASYIEKTDGILVYLDYLDIQDSRALSQMKFIYLNPKADLLLSKIEDILKKAYVEKYINEEESSQDEKKEIEDERSRKEETWNNFEYLKSGLKSEATNMYKFLNSNLKYDDVVDILDDGKERVNYGEDVEACFEEWYGYYEDLLQLHSTLLE
ncbi:hypothetical protein P9135_28995, partial [Bacillus thuringiensis]